MILLYVLACAYPDFLGDSDPSDTAPSDTDPVDTDVPTPCGEEPVQTSTVELDTNSAIMLAGVFSVATGGPGELLVTRIVSDVGRVERLAVTRQGTSVLATFERPGDAIVPASETLGVAGDLDSDGKLDVPLVRSGSPCVVHLHAFTEDEPESITVGTSARACAIVADVTGDGHADLVVTDLLLQGNTHGFSVWDGVALTSGSTTPWATYGLDELRFGPLGAMQIADLDRDGIDEIVFATGGEGAQDAPAVASVDLVHNTFPTTVDTALIRSKNQGDQGEASLALGDWDGDGDLDPAGAFWQFPSGPGAMLGHDDDAAGEIPFEGALFRWSEVAPTSLGLSAAGLGDFDGGGCDDLALVVDGDPEGRIAIYGGTSLRGDLQKVTPSIAITPAGTFLLGRGLVAPGDLDGDGSPELIALGWEGSTTGILTAWVFFGGAR